MDELDRSKFGQVQQEQNAKTGIDESDGVDRRQQVVQQHC